jgi:glyoxylase-like metal-dependent hydrolase (beta-lactamase superfamily II)
MRQVADSVFIEIGYEGVNVGAVMTPRGVIAIDVPSYPRQARDWAHLLHGLSSRPVQFVVLTDANGDRALNSRWMNAPIVAQQYTADMLHSYDKRYPSGIGESLAMRNPNRSRELSSGVVERPFMSFSHNMHIHRGGCEVVLLAAAGPTLGNAWVYLPQAQILFAGDTVVVGQHPILYEPTSKRWLMTLRRLQDWPEALRLIVTGRGALASSADVALLITYLEEMRACVAELWERGGQRAETADLIANFVNYFPHETAPLDWLRLQIQRSLEHVYDEIQLERAE